MFTELDKGRQNNFKDPLFSLDINSNLDYAAYEGQLLVESSKVADYKFP